MTREQPAALVADVPIVWPEWEENERFTVAWRLLGTRAGAVGTLILLLLVATGLFGSLLAPFDPIELHLESALQGPSATYWFGTDELGRDLFSRIIVGARTSLMVGLAAVLVGAIVGSITGLIAGYRSGWFDSVSMRVWDTLLAFPAIFLAIGVLTILGPGRVSATVAIALISMPTFARLVRAVTLSVKHQEFVEAARAIGCPDRYIIFRTIFPNCVPPIMVEMAISASNAIVIEAGLSFLGLGVQPPAPSWGNMLSTAQTYLYQAPLYAVFPGLAITMAVLGLNLFADGLREAIDPHRVRSGGT